MSNINITLKDIGSSYELTVENMSFLNYMQYKPLLEHLIANKAVKQYPQDAWLLKKDNNIIDFLNSNYDTIITKESKPWDNIGKDLKYEPYDYQKETVHFAINNPKSLLLLGCGAGKTFIAITIYNEAVKNKMTNKPGMIVVKASLKYQWVKEVGKFSSFRAKAIDTPSKAKKKFDSQFEEADLFILNYETLKNEKVVTKLREKEVEFLAFDESQYINNAKSERAKALYKFNDLPIIIGTTATPITNNPLNVFGIFNMINPDIFDSYSKFSSNYIKWAGFGRVAGIKNKDHMIAKIKPYVFIKSEEEIADQLPSLIVNQYYCELTPAMRAINEQLQQELEQVRNLSDDIESRIKDQKLLEFNEEYLGCKAKIMAYQTFMQELADDPRLLSLSQSDMAKQYSCNDKSPKLDLLLDLLEPIIESGDKVCIFTKYQRMQQLLIQEIESKLNIKVAYVNGTQDPQERYRQAYDLFRDADEYKVFIVTEAGNAGISLSLCRYLIEYDLADSYANQTQRHGRIKRADSIHRTGYVYQLICTGSYDEIAQKIVSKKEKYDNELIKVLSNK